MTRQQKSFCRICMAACGIVVEVDGERVVAVRGDKDHPLSKGYLCPKGRALPAMHHDGRLEGTLVRRGDVVEQVSTAEGLDDLAVALADVVEAHGLGSVGIFLGTAGYLDPAAAWASRKLKTALATKHAYSTASIDSIAKVAVPILMTGTSTLVPHPDGDARLVLYVGSNPVVSHGHATTIPNPIERIRDARRQGEVWVIDPRRTETAALADGHLAPRPGTDHAVLAYVVRSLLADPVDADHLETLGESTTGLDALRDAVAPFDRQHVSALSGVAAGDLDALLAAVRRAGRLAVVSGTGTTMARAANVTEWLTWALLVITDSIDQPGGMWCNPGYFARLDRREVLPSVRFEPSGPPSMPGVARMNDEWPAALIPAEIEAGRLRALIVLGGNPALALPDQERVAAAFRSLDVLVVLDIGPTATTDLATHAFGCADQLERPDLTALDMFTNVLATQYTDAVVEASEGRPPMWRMLCLIGQRLGLDVLGKGADAAVTPTDTILGRLARGTDIDELRRADGPVIDADAVHGWIGSRLPHAWDLAPAPLVAQLDELPDLPVLVATPRRQLRRQNGRAYRDTDRPEALVHPDDAARTGVVDGALVEVRSAHGSLELTARITDHLPAGSVSIPHGWGDTNVNLLTSATELDALTGMPLYSGIPVELHRVAG